MTRYLLANLAGLLLIAFGAVGVIAAAVVLLDGWQLLGATSCVAIVAGVPLSRLDSGVA